MASSSDADYVGKVLNEVRDQIAVDDDVLSETKARRNLVKRMPESLKELSRRSSLISGTGRLGRAGRRRSFTT